MQFGDTCVFVTVEDVGSFLKIAGPGNFEIRIRLPSVEVANVIARAIESTKDAANSAQLPLSKPCTCKRISMSKCIRPSLAIDSNCPQHGSDS